ncbi:structure-specific endonuclease subunit SLX1 homolog [Coffea eugenioides]|uniref:structure-specific endonuclease subunit SLX1 homolog n=1 Tax=Coffea eugenioides TaxID=49369 RepID=UPI000F60FD68|nr:structure-specific endonuclease subunit SLX1 homolog [Coffea eugenioides]
MARLLSRTFKSLKPHHNINPCPKPLLKAPTTSVATPSKSEFSSSSPSLKTAPEVSSSKSKSKSKSRLSKSLKNSWSVYLILSTNPPIKTYVGVTTNFSRRLKQHNGEVNGGAKASRAGRPWVCACFIKGFRDKSEACEFESKWKLFSRKLSRKRKTIEEEKQDDNRSLALLHHRHAALSRVKSSVVCSHLEIIWHFDLT